MKNKAQIVFLVDVVRMKDSVIPLNVFDNSKKIFLDFLCITAEKVSYNDPGVIRVYDVHSISHSVDFIRLRRNATKLTQVFHFPFLKDLLWVNYDQFVKLTLLTVLRALTFIYSILSFS